MACWDGDPHEAMEAPPVWESGGSSNMRSVVVFVAPEAAATGTIGSGTAARSSGPAQARLGLKLL